MDPSALLDDWILVTRVTTLQDLRAQVTRDYHMPAATQGFAFSRKPEGDQHYRVRVLLPIASFTLEGLNTPNPELLVPVPQELRLATEGRENWQHANVGTNFYGMVALSSWHTRVGHPSQIRPGYIWLFPSTPTLDQPALLCGKQYEFMDTNGVFLPCITPLADRTLPMTGHARMLQVIQDEYWPERTPMPRTNFIGFGVQKVAANTVSSSDFQWRSGTFNSRPGVPHWDENRELNHPSLQEAVIVTMAHYLQADLVGPRQ